MATKQTTTKVPRAQRGQLRDHREPDRGAGLGPAQVQRGHLVHPPTGVGQRHDRQVPHPDVIDIEAVHQGPADGHQTPPVADHQSQHNRPGRLLGSRRSKEVERGKRP